MRVLTVGLAAMAVSSAWSQITGPTPLAWRWVQPTSVAPSGTPVVVGDTAYVGVGSRLFALDRETGNQKWKFPLADPIDGYFRSGVIVSDGLAIAAGDNKTIYAVDATNGELKWQTQLQSAVVCAPVKCGAVVVAMLSDNTMQAYKIADGSPVWENPVRLFDGVQGNPIGIDSNIVFFTQRNELVSFNTVNLKSDWRQRFNQVTPDVTPVQFGDNLYVSSGTFVTVLNAARGSLRWQKDLGETLVFNPAVTANGIAVASREGNLHFLNLNGNIVTMKDEKGRTSPALIDLQGPPAAAPSAIGKLVAVPTAVGAINLYDPSNMELKWSYTIRPYTSGLKMRTTTSTRTGGGNTGGSPSGGNSGGNTGGTTEEKPLVAVPAAGPAVSVGDSMMVLVLDGSLLSFDNNFGVDVTAPEVKMAWPSPGAQVNGTQLDVVFQIDDEATGIKDSSLKVDVNGQPCKVEFGQDGIAVIRFNAFAKNPALNNGRAKFTVSVSDWMGNARSSTFSLYIDNTLKPLGLPKDQPGGDRGAGGTGGGPSTAGSGGGKVGGGGR